MDSLTKSTLSHIIENYKHEVVHEVIGNEIEKRLDVNLFFYHDYVIYAKNKREAFEQLFELLDNYDRDHLIGKEFLYDGNADFGRRFRVTKCVVCEEQLEMTCDEYEQDLWNHSALHTRDEIIDCLMNANIFDKKKFVVSK